VAVLVEVVPQPFKTEILEDLVVGGPLLEREAREAQELQGKAIMVDQGLLRQVMAAGEVAGPVQ
jgi:hypothetical protein